MDHDLRNLYIFVMYIEEKIPIKFCGRGLDLTWSTENFEMSDTVQVVWAKLDVTVTSVTA